MKQRTKLLLFLAAFAWLPALPQPPVLDAMEYYFDTDPGFGNGTAVTITPGTVLSTSFDLDVSALDAGAHKAYIRVRNASGDWSLTFKSVVFKVVYPSASSSTDLVEMEYFIDVDPGFGNGTSVSITVGPTVSKSFAIDLTGLDPGFHKVYFRALDDGGNWSHTHVHEIIRVSTVVPPAQPTVQAMEYFFDTDPGVGNANSVSITPGQTIDETFEIDISSLEAGYHKLYIRTKDANDDWSLVFVHNLIKVTAGDPSDALDLVGLEYFIDEDPGFGNGNSIPIGPAPSIEMTFDADLSDISAGDHDLYIRVLDEEGMWSLVSTASFLITEADLNAFLEGPFAGSEMNTTLNSAGLIPLQQPFNASPWVYEGDESVGAIPNSDVVDWILLETRHAPDPSSATDASVSSRHAGFLLKDGSIVDLDGVSNLLFNAGSTSNNYLVIRHRNHLEMLSSSELNFTGGIFQYDFTSGAGQAYGSIQKSLGSGIYGMYAGDLNGDGLVNMDDLAEEWDLETGSAGYLDADINLDTQADNADKNDLWLPNNSIVSPLPD